MRRCPPNYYRCLIQASNCYGCMHNIVTNIMSFTARYSNDVIYTCTELPFQSHNIMSKITDARNCSSESYFGNGAISAQRKVYRTPEEYECSVK